MKKMIKDIAALVLTVMVVGCNNSSKFEGQFSGDNLKAFQIAEKTLPRGTKMEDCQVLRAKLPLALLDTEYKSVRDQVNKARLDYRACLTRGLTGPAQKNVETLVEVQNMIKEKSEALEASSPEYLFVLMKVKEGSSGAGLRGYITIFDPSTMEKVDEIQVTKPVYNNAMMVAEALAGVLSDPDCIDDPASLHDDNPIVQFVLGCDPK